MAQNAIFELWPWPAVVWPRYSCSKFATSDRYLYSLIGLNVYELYSWCRTLIELMLCFCCCRKRGLGISNQRWARPCSFTLLHCVIYTAKAARGGSKFTTSVVSILAHKFPCAYKPIFFSFFTRYNMLTQSPS